MGEGERQRDTQPWTQQSSVVDLHSNTCAQSVGGDGRWAMGDGRWAAEGGHDAIRTASPTTQHTPKVKETACNTLQIRS
jgi:hypothetical protein